jgi:hypothetical protein
MDVNIAAAGVRHHKAEPLLFIKEFDCALNHGAARAAIAPLAGPITAKALMPPGKSITASKSIPAPEPVPSAEAISASKLIVTSEPVTAAKAISTAKAISAPVPIAAKAPTTATWPARGFMLGGAGVHAVDGYHLEPPRGVLQVANNRGTRGHIRRSYRRQRRCMAKRIAAVLKRDKTVALGGVEPFHRAFGRGHGKRT